ncbi:hypothetical protein C5167_035455 [Papaver somniferum]|uniref:Uncharacterized protein n=1 Tax=Papaver somniferum TaxID=3469 RepID=A0A4Y7KK22_PAPSO|nr:hypothetical protein C5167_035455 [Papaver somniferum]
MFLYQSLLIFDYINPQKSYPVQILNAYLSPFSFQNSYFGAPRTQVHGPEINPTTIKTATRMVPHFTKNQASAIALGM